MIYYRGSPARARVGTAWVLCERVRPEARIRRRKSMEPPRGAARMRMYESVPRQRARHRGADSASHDALGHGVGLSAGLHFFLSKCGASRFPVVGPSRARARVSIKTHYFVRASV